MKQNDDTHWLDPMLEEHIRRTPKEFDFATWEQKHPHEARLLHTGYEHADRNVKTKNLQIWRTLMESKVTRYSAAAVIVLALALVLFGPLGGPGNGGVVLADVQEKVSNIATLKIRGTKTFTLPGEDGAVFEFAGIKGEFDLVKYFSKQHGLVEEGYAAGELIYRFTFNRPERQTLLILPLNKKYGKFPSTDAQMRLLESGTPQGIVNLLLEGQHQALGRDKINDIETEVFAFQETGVFKELLPKAIVDIQSITGKVWIGIEEQLPVRVEGDFSIGKSFMTLFRELKLHEVNEFYDLDVELDEAIFATTPPAGYAELTLADILQVVPAEAKAGLAGLGIAPVAGLVFWKQRKKKRATTNPK